jgi:hypothetical protein
LLNIEDNQTCHSVVVQDENKQHNNYNSSIINFDPIKRSGGNHSKLIIGANKNLSENYISAYHQNNSSIG